MNNENIIFLLFFKVIWELWICWNKRERRQSQSSQNHPLHLDWRAHQRPVHRQHSELCHEHRLSGTDYILQHNGISLPQQMFLDLSLDWPKHSKCFERSKRFRPEGYRQVKWIRALNKWHEEIIIFQFEFHQLRCC